MNAFNIANFIKSKEKIYKKDGAYASVSYEATLAAMQKLEELGMNASAKDLARAGNNAQAAAFDLGIMGDYCAGGKAHKAKREGGIGRAHNLLFLSGDAPTITGGAS